VLLGEAEGEPAAELPALGDDPDVAELPALEAGVLAPVGPGASDVVFRHVVDPGLTVNGADWAVAPVLSRRVKPREVPAGWLTVHVTEVPFSSPRFSSAAAVGDEPGRTLK